MTSWTVGCQDPLSMGTLQARINWSGLPCSPSGDLPNPGVKPKSPALQADSLPSEPPGKPKNSGVGSLCLLQRNFLTQESNQGLLHCRWILYQLSYQESPRNIVPLILKKACKHIFSYISPVGNIGSYYKHKWICLHTTVYLASCSLA